MRLTSRLLCIGSALLLAGAAGCTSEPSPPQVPDSGTPPGPVYPPIVDRTSCSGLTVGPGNYT